MPWEILRRLRYCHRLVKLRTMAKNELQAIALSAGLSMESRLLTKPGRAQLELLDLSPALKDQWREWLDLIDQLNHYLARLEAEVEQAGEADSRVRLLRTHRGIGPRAALALPPYAGASDALRDQPQGDGLRRARAL